MIRHLPLQLFVLFLVCLFSVTAVSAANNRIPTSKKSEESYRRVAPKLISEMMKKDLNLGDPVFIRIFKLERTLEIWIRKGLTYKLFKSYPICDFSGTLGPKIREGDKQSPEGFYTVGISQLNPHSNYHLSFNLGFPNEYDRSRKRTGSVLMVHGRCSSAGCYAMMDYRMEEIYAIVESAIILGQQQVPVHIFPFHMTDANMKAFSDSKWLSFWKNLKKGYDHFEGHKFPPLVTVQDREYKFLTFQPILFGGKFPERNDSNNNYAEYKKTGHTTAPPQETFIVEKNVDKVQKPEKTKVARNLFRKKTEEDASYL